MSKADEEKAARLAAALRENLRKRKAQARAAVSVKSDVETRTRGEPGGDDHHTDHESAPRHPLEEGRS